jgi:hypothetical protein
MTTLLGPVPCRECRSTVWVVRRRLAFLCATHQGVCSTPSKTPHVVGDDGSTHLCKGNARSVPMGYDATDGSSVTSSDTIGNGRASARPRGAVVPCLEV